MNRCPHGGIPIALLAIMAFTALGGCLGKVAPVEEYLRVLGRGPGCEYVARGEQGGGTAKEIIALKTLKVTESLDRQSVMLANGRVLTPSQRWYWEATPGMLFSQGIMRDINCSSRLAAVWPMRSSTKAARVLAGQVTAFEVQTRGMVVRASAQCQLWDGEETQVLAVHDFEATAPVSDLSAQTIADAGAAVLASISGDVRAWIEGTAKAK